MFNKNKFEALLKLHNISKDELADFLGISKSYLYRKIREGGDFTVKEIGLMIGFFGKEEVLDSLFDCDESC